MYATYDGLWIVHDLQATSWPELGQLGEQSGQRTLEKGINEAWAPMSSSEAFIVRNNPQP